MSQTVKIGIVVFEYQGDNFENKCEALRKFLEEHEFVCIGLDFGKGIQPLLGWLR